MIMKKLVSFRIDENILKEIEKIKKKFSFRNKTEVVEKLLLKSIKKFKV